MSATIAALLSLLSALIVAVLSHVFTMRRNRQDELAELRLKAYADFINAASRLVAARRLGQVIDEIAELAALNDAKTRICVCANAAVIAALADFWEHGGTLERESEILAFTRLCMTIRESLGNSPRELHGVKLSNLLFKLQPSTYSFKYAVERSRQEAIGAQDDPRSERKDG